MTQFSLTLENVRCFGKQRFTFNLQEFTLISGPSGVGKSTLFIALAFAINGDSKYLCSIGKKQCKVSFETPQMTIVRSKGPNKLVVKVNDPPFELEEKVAQGYINRAFPNFELGYVPQKLHKSFLAKSPAQKLEFIEHVAFDTEYLTRLVTNCKGLLSERKTNLIKAQQHVVTSESTLTKLNIPRVEINPCVESKDELQEQVTKQGLLFAQRKVDVAVTQEHSKQLREAMESYDTTVHKITMKESTDQLKDLIRQNTNQTFQWVKYQKALRELRKVEVPSKEYDLTVLRDELHNLTVSTQVTRTLNKKKGRILDLKNKLSTNLKGVTLDEVYDVLSDLTKVQTKVVNLSKDQVTYKKLAEALRQQKDIDETLHNLNLVLSLKKKTKVLDTLQADKVKYIGVNKCPHCSELVGIWNNSLEKVPLMSHLQDLSLIHI